MNVEDEITLWLGAARYYMGRRSYAVSSFTDLLIQSWPSLQNRTKTLIQKDVEDEFKRDDLSREMRVGIYHPLGDDCDRHSWESLRKLWQ